MTEKMYIPSTFVSMQEADRKGHKGVEVKYVTDKSGTEIVDFVFNTTLQRNNTLKDILTSLAKGDKIKVQKEKKGKFSNLVAVYKNDGTTSTSRFTTTRHTGSSNVDFNTRAARGQALNLAVTVAVAEGKHNSDDFIMSQVDRFLKLGELVQQGVSSEVHKKISKGLEDADAGRVKKVTDLEDLI